MKTFYFFAMSASAQDNPKTANDAMISASFSLIPPW
jgi:hypothetical protein